MNEFELDIAAALQKQYGPHWFTHGANAQTMLAYVQAQDEASRSDARATMKRDAVFYAVGVIQAAIHAGMVKTV